VDLLKPVVALDSEILVLTRMEYRLLAILVSHAGDIVPRSILLKLTGPLDVHLWRLQKKLGKYGNQYIETVTGVGNRFRPLPPRG
jgi:DNA-binding response OmpR family regulator